MYVKVISSHKDRKAIRHTSICVHTATDMAGKQASEQTSKQAKQNKASNIYNIIDMYM